MQLKLARGSAATSVPPVQAIFEFTPSYLHFIHFNFFQLYWKSSELFLVSARVFFIWTFIFQKIFREIAYSSCHFSNTYHFIPDFYGSFIIFPCSSTHCFLNRLHTIQYFSLARKWIDQMNRSIPLFRKSIAIAVNECIPIRSIYLPNEMSISV